MKDGRHYRSKLRCDLNAVIIGAGCAVSPFAFAQSVTDYAVRVSAVVQANPARITLSWPADSQAINYILARKTRDATSWGNSTMLAGDAINYVDSNVVVGGDCEYQVGKLG